MLYGMVQYTGPIYLQYTFDPYFHVILLYYCIHVLLQLSYFILLAPCYVIVGIFHYNCHLSLLVLCYTTVAIFHYLCTILHYCRHLSLLSPWYVTVGIFHYLYCVTVMLSCFITIAMLRSYVGVVIFALHVTLHCCCQSLHCPQFLHLYLTIIPHAIHHHSTLRWPTVGCSPSLVIVGRGAIGPTFRHVRPPSRVFSHFVCRPLVHEISPHMTFSSYYTR